ncbi:DNA translocase FtsK [Weissella ceti]|uniref:DNA translocase FtsK n=1 Tax=Weissella ceti TaxID=759620 RepID=A0ABT3E2W4_9LACO|nr:DNA translocase FtsK [Weissella ceti]MCW0952756.1 DNA translocase FtsK [Weissella ceti]QVK12455.1 DNA translocase FtsK [Weissella ceti]
MAAKTTKTKKPAAKRKTSKKKTQNDWLSQHWGQLTALALTLCTVFAILQVGLLGKFFANCVRWIVGGSYQFLLLIALMPLLVLVAYAQWPKRFKTHHYVGFAIFYAGIMLVNSILFFSPKHMYIDLASKVTQFINQDFANHSSATPVGGGVLGAQFYEWTHMIAGNFGAWLVAILMLIGGFVVMFKVPVREVFDNFFTLAEGTGDFVQTQASQVHDVVTEKVTTFRENQRQNMTDVFKDNPFSTEAEKAEEISASATKGASITKSKKRKPDFEQEVTTTGADYSPPEIIAPEPQVAKVQSAPVTKPQAVPVTNTMKSMDLPPLPPEPIYDDDFVPGDVIQSADEMVDPITIQPDLPEAAIDDTLSHAAIFGHDDAKTSPKTTAKPNSFGHVEPTTQTMPTVDVDASGLGNVIDDRDYDLPTTDLMTEIGSTDQSAERDALNEKARLLHETLKSFNINATVEKVVLGPTVTQYEIKPAVGVKVSKIQNLADDLALALAAKSLRIEAPIPGKNVVGIEVANDQQATVGFRDMMDEAGIDTENPLVVPIGRGVTSGVVKMDLTKMPHLLIAGSTGSGKSVAINGILASILLQAKPSQVRLMLVDPKKVELSVYNDIPHLITPVVSDPKKASLGLKKVVAEMDRRFKVLAEEGVRNIDGYNRFVQKHNATSTESVLQEMPYLVVIIDELADLMMTSSVSGDVENSIVRIAQLGRAAGIHMIVATQRPSVDIITGLIKANVPSRMAFAVSSGIDSRTILDSNGAEKLLGRGDMLFSPIGSSGPQRVQGAFLSDEDVENLTDFIKAQGEAQYDDAMTVSEAEMQSLEQGDSGDGNDLDEQWDDVLEFVLRANGASTSSIQRHFKMGYNRAGRIVDDMADRGLIGGPNGSKPREVHFTAEMLPSLRRNAQNKPM